MFLNNACTLKLYQNFQVILQSIPPVSSPQQRVTGSMQISGLWITSVSFYTIQYFLLQSQNNYEGEIQVQW